VSLVLLVWVGCLASCSAGSADLAIATTFDVCTPIVVDVPDATAEQLASLDDAIEMWRTRGVMMLSRTDALTSAPHVELRFQHAAANFHGLYDDAAGVIYVNDVLGDRRERAVTIAHELGHSFGLLHVAPEVRASVMNPANLTVLPTGDDEVALATIWGRCP